jgi:hypothetical protein
MKEEALAIVRDVTDPARKLNLLREYLQALVLRSLHESEAFLYLAFVGGTALRFVHNLPRFSEDMDFALEATAGYRARDWMTKVKNDLTLSGMDTTVNWNEKGTVHKAWIRIGGILADAGLSSLPAQKLSIKLEIDTRPPAGAVCQRTLVDRHRLLALQHYTLPSLMAGKAHALITRKYPKGRDWYDLLWYLARQPRVTPNLTQLRNALDQTQGKGVADAQQWRKAIASRLDEIDCNVLANDVQPFLERPDEASLLTRDTFLAALAEGT